MQMLKQRFRSHCGFDLSNGVHKIGLIYSTQGRCFHQRGRSDEPAFFPIEKTQRLQDSCCRRSPGTINIAAECNDYHATYDL
jgi:hypothetical protein